MKALLRIAVVYVAISIALGALALLQSFPARPTTWVGWLLLFALALPVTLIGEFVGDALFRNPVSRAVERNTQGQAFSWLRVVMGLALMLFVFATVLAAGLLMNGPFY